MKGEGVERSEWLEKLRKTDRYVWMSDDQWECACMVFDLVGGEHHLTGKIKEFGTGIEYNTRYHYLSTFDNNTLTTAVFMAHDRMIRFSVEPSGPGMVRWTLFKRHMREGEMSQRHPTIQQALEKYRQTYPETGVLQ